MPMCSATRRASWTSSSEQQRPVTFSGIPSCPASRRWFQSCMVRPTTLCPSARIMAATVEESTPPDMATAIVLGIDMLESYGLLLVPRRKFAQPRNSLGHQRQREVDIFSRILLAQTEANTRSSSVCGQAHGNEHVRWLNRSRGTGSASGNRKALQIEGNDHRLAFDVIEIDIRRIRHTWSALAVHPSLSRLTE